jgi:FkbM family methyltransferase
MNAFLRRLKSSLEGNWIRRALWIRNNPPPSDRSALYDWQTINVMFRVLCRHSNCVDMGAHTGDILSHMIYISPRGKHYAFEPLPHLAQRLRERFPGVILHQAAVSDESGESEFLFVENDPGYSGLRRRRYDRPDPKITPIRVRVVTLDQVIPLNEKIDFIKIDIEGAEFHALKGAIETIRRNNPVIVFEGGSYSTGQYGVKSDDVYLLVTQTLGYELSTMRRWLKQEAPYTREEFEHNWNHGPDYYFLAIPKGKSRHRAWRPK